MIFQFVNIQKQVKYRMGYLISSIELNITSYKIGEVISFSPFCLLFWFLKMLEEKRRKGTNKGLWPRDDKHSFGQKTDMLLI